MPDTVRDKPTLKGYFLTGDTPTQQQFADTITTFLAFDPTNTGRVYHPNSGSFPDTYIEFTSTGGVRIVVNGVEAVNYDA